METEGPVYGETEGTTTPGHTPGTPVGHVTVGFEEPPASGGGNKAILIVAIAGLALAGFGVVRSLTVGHPKPEPAPAARSVFSEQAQFMREAMAMAREAHQMQREQMQFMREMEAAVTEDRTVAGWADDPE